jgi:hypothetical protein
MPSGFIDGGITFGGDDEPGPSAVEGAVSPSGQLDAVGYMPLLIGGQWHNAVLLNSATANVDAWAIYRNDLLPSKVGYRRWSQRYPSGSPTADAMPKANVAATWGDYLVLGDIVWKSNPSQPLSADNQVRYPHGLWFSEPGVMDSWDELEVEFVGQRSGSNAVVGLFPVEAGLIVASTSGIYLLRGTPDDHSYEDLRVGVGPKCRCAVKYWPLPGVVVWVNDRGQVWQTNGEDFGRLDEPLPTYDHTLPSSLRDDALGVLDEYLMLSRAGRMFVLRAEQGRAAWTELNGPYARGVAGYRGSFYTRGDTGIYRYSLELPDQRGHRDGEPVDIEVATRPLGGDDPHEVTYWHRFGLRVAGGRLLEAASKAGPYGTDAPELLLVSPEMGDARDLAVWPAHGPSVESSYRWRLEGNLSLESATVWAHRGRASR